MDYLTVKWIHILSSTVLFGTGLGIAFFLFMAHRTRDTIAIAAIARIVVIADWLFTTTAVVVQPISGWWLAVQAGFSFSQTWLWLSIALYIFAGACWLPVVWIQLQLRWIASQAAQTGQALPARYWRLARIWTALGFPAFGALLLVFYLMIGKPV